MKEKIFIVEKVFDRESWDNHLITHPVKEILFVGDEKSTYAFYEKAQKALASGEPLRSPSGDSYMLFGRGENESLHIRSVGFNSMVIPQKYLVNDEPKVSLGSLFNEVFPN